MRSIPLTRRWGGVLGSRLASSGQKSGVPNRGPVTWGSALLTAALGGGLLMYYQSEKERRQTTTTTTVKAVGKAALGGPWTLVDDSGLPTTDADLAGQHTLFYFGFTRCPDICPSELVKVGEIIDELDRRVGPKGPKVLPVFISVDPMRDSVEQLREYSRDFHPRMLFLTGTPDQVAAATRAYRVYFSKADAVSDQEYLVDHSIVMYLNGPDGEFLEFFTQSSSAADAVKKIMPIITA